MRLCVFCRLNVGISWSEYYGIVDVEIIVSVLLFNYIVEVFSIRGSLEFLFDVLRKGKEEILMYIIFLKLDIVELCKDNLDVVFMKVGSFSMVGLLLNEEEVLVFINIFLLFGVLVLIMVDWILSLDELVLCVDVKSFWELLLLGVL